MLRQPQSNSAIQVIGRAVQQDLIDLLPGAARCDRPARPVLDDRDERLDVPLPGPRPDRERSVELAAIGKPRQATGWPPYKRRNDALEPQICSPPAVVGLGVIATIGQQAREAQPV
jgi:hypothetical protein